MSGLTLVDADVARIAVRGREIYDRCYKERFEKHYPGKWVAIDVNTEEAYIGDTAEQARELAHTESNRVTHLLRVGMAAAYHHHGANAL